MASNRLIKAFIVLGLLFSGPIVLGQDLSNLERVLREKIAEAEREHRRNLKNSQGDDYGSNVRSGPSETERIRQERERKEEQRRHDEEVRRQREEEFKADKANLQGTLKGIDVGESSIGFCAGLRGLSDDGPNNNNQASYSKGLRGLAETSPSPNGNSNYSSGLRGIQMIIQSNIHLQPVMLPQRLIRESIVMMLLSPIPIPKTAKRLQILIPYMLFLHRRHI